MYQYKIKKIKRIIDGDTVDVDIDLGFGIVLSQRKEFVSRILMQQKQEL